MKRFFSWLASVPLGLLLIALVLATLIHDENMLRLLTILLIVNFPFAVASIVWLGLQASKSGFVNWVVSKPNRRLVFQLIVILASISIGILIARVRR
jgi:hypothetical protein